MDGRYAASGMASPDSCHLLHSPPRLPPSRGKERRQPSITPRKFRRFFTPRARVSSQPSAARRALRDLAVNASDRYRTPSSPLKPPTDDIGAGHGPETPRNAKRRKVYHSLGPETSPLLPSSALDLTPVSLAKEPMGGKATLLSPIDSIYPSQELYESDDDVYELESPCDALPASRVVPLTRRGLAGHLVQRQLGDTPDSGRHFMSYPVADWRVETADFCSQPDDVHFCSSHEARGRCIPFCTATCHNNTLVAVGDEEGMVRLLETNRSSPEDFKKIHLKFQTHGNAIIDLAFSEDDYLLATASGDQTGKVIDMTTQTPIAILDHHLASVKQVRFQPGKGSGSVLATSSRDGSVKIWDLRCKGPSVQDITPSRDVNLNYRLPRKVQQGCVVNSIYDAHARTLRQARLQTAVGPAGDVATRGEARGRNDEVSVTALQFMPTGQEHLLLSACEADAGIKLWDIRNIHSSRSKTSSPVSVTSQPDSHSQWRPFGISSMTLSTDGGRLYAVCKDNTVYAYSTSHLVLGHAPELSTRGEPPKRRNATAQEGLGPLYGFRHESFHATSFYVKSAMRPARDGQSELLAVGSSDGCAMLFPTAERYLQHYSASNAVETCSTSTLSTSVVTRSQQQRQRPGLSRTNSISNLNARLGDTIPTYRNGTPLVRGHDKEVGALSWTSQGKLVTLGDDYLIRCWEEDREKAADLRTGGESEGRRWASGWADVGDNWDEDEW